MGPSKYEIYGTDDCTFCNKAKWILEHYNKPYIYINVTENKDTTAAFFKKFPNVKTVPQIMFEGKDRGYPVHIGGYKELERWLKDLQKYLDKHPEMEYNR